MKSLKIGVGYARTSGIINPKTSIPTQVDTIKKYCKSNNIILKHIFVDECKTGTKVEGREQYQELKKLIKREQIDVVLVSFSDRLARDSYEFILTMNEMAEQNIEFISISENLTSHHMTPLQIVMMGLQVELENKQRNQRIVESAMSKYREGKFIYSRKPYGYDIDENYYLIIKEDEAAIVRRIFKEFLKGKGLMQIARELNAEGLYNKEKEKPWSNVKVNTILERKTYTGIIYRKEYENDQYIYNKISDKKHPVIISEEMFEEVQKIKQQKVRKKKEIKNSHFLSGILVCPNCQSKMYGQSERDIYQCKGNKTNHSTCPTIKKAVVEKLVFQWLIQKDASNSTFNSNERNNVQEDQVYKKIMVEKEQCELKFAKALISTETYTKNMESINERLKQLQEGKDILVYIQETETYESLIKENNLEQLKKRLKKENIRFTFDEEMKIIQLEDKPTT